MNSLTVWEEFLALEVIISIYPVRITAEIMYTKGIMPPDSSPEGAHFSEHRGGGLDQWFLFLIGHPNNTGVEYSL